jgi:signal transduction histidine kinase
VLQRRPHAAQAERGSQQLEDLLHCLDTPCSADEDSTRLLLSTATRELRSPVTSVQGLTATLLNKWVRFTDDQKRVMLETVNADADQVAKLITQLPDVSQIESGRMEIHRQLVDLPDRARKIIEGRVGVGDADDRFRLEVRYGLPATWLDADRIDQILGELVANAVVHGTGVVTIVVEPTYLNDNEAVSMSASDPGSADAVAVSVRDQGEGIPPDVARQVFRQFWRDKRHNGAGLGLYIVKGLVEAHGGTIGVQSAPGGGAEFRFIVPAGTATVRSAQTAMGVKALYRVRDGATKREEKTRG